VLVLVEVLLLAHQRWVTGATAVAGRLRGHGSNVAVLGRSLFTTYLMPFEVTSALLVVAVIGAVVLARRPHPNPELSAPGSPGEASIGDPVPADGDEPAGAQGLAGAQGEAATARAVTP